MIAYLIFTFCNLLTLSLIFGFYHGCAKPNGHLLLTVTLPANYLSDINVTEISEKYKKKCIFVFFALFITALSFYFLRNYIVISSMLLLIYSFAVVVIYSVLLEHYRKRLIMLKKQRNWFVSKTHIITIDTEVSRFKSTFPVSRKHFIFPVILSLLILLLYYFCEKETLLSNIIASFALISVFICSVAIYEIFARLPSKIYCENSEVNIALNRSYKHECSKMCIWLMYSGVAMLPMVITPPTDNNYLFSVLFSGLLSTAICLFAVLKAFLKIRHQRNKFVSLIENDIEIDDDECLHYGLYYNPNDNKTFVETRVGFGIEINYAKTAGKIMAAIITALIVWLFWFFITLLPFDFIKGFDLQQNGNTFTINTTIYSDTFSKEEIISVNKLTEIKKGSRTNGASTSNYMVGNFNILGYGDVRMYVLHNVQLYLAVELKNKPYVFINGKDIAETEKFYKMLTE